MIGHFEKNAKDWSLPDIFQLKWLSMWLYDWAEILCGNVSRLEEHAHKILRDLYERFARYFKTEGVSLARHAHFVGVWHVVALSEGTSLRHREISSCVFSEILYGGSWGRMRKVHKIRRSFER